MRWADLSDRLYRRLGLPMRHGTITPSGCFVSIFDSEPPRCAGVLNDPGMMAVSVGADPDVTEIADRLGLTAGTAVAAATAFSPTTCTTVVGERGRLGATDVAKCGLMLLHADIRLE